jgi:H+/Cl- antiporter ClcA
MDAIYYKEGVIRPVVALIKSLASALSIGTGAAVGREGPIIQIGAALGSTLGQLVREGFQARRCDARQSHCLSRSYQYRPAART